MATPIATFTVTVPVAVGVTRRDHRAGDREVRGGGIAERDIAHRKPRDRLQEGERRREGALLVGGTPVIVTVGAVLSTT